MILRSPRDETVSRQNHDCSKRRSDQAGSFVWPIPSQTLSKKRRNERSHDAENCRQDKARRLVLSRHDEFRNDASQESDNNRPDNAHSTDPLSVHTQAKTLGAGKSSIP